METKHTPGPWEIEPKERRENPLYVMDSEGNRIAKCDGLNMADFGPDAPTCRANARLILSSPDLLAVCKRLVHWGSPDNDDRDDDVSHEVLLEIEDAAKAAIAKAEGKANAN